MLGGKSSDTADNVNETDNLNLTQKRIGQESPQEYLAKYDAKTNPQKILIFAKHLTDKGNDTFSSEDVKKMFLIAREPNPGNFIRDVKMTIRKGWITPTGDDGMFVITNTGDKQLETKFKSGDPLKTKIKRKNRSNNFVEVKINPAIESAEFEPILSGYVSFLDLSTSADKILWILLKSKLLGISKLNQKEIELISRRLGDVIPRKSISSLIEKHRSSKRIWYHEDSGVKYLEIQNSGEIYLKNLNIVNGEVPERSNGSAS